MIAFQFFHQYFADFTYNFRIQMHQFDKAVYPKSHHVTKRSYLVKEMENLWKIMEFDYRVGLNRAIMVFVHTLIINHIYFFWQ